MAQKAPEIKELLRRSQDADEKPAGKTLSNRVFRLRKTP